MIDERSRVVRADGVPVRPTLMIAVDVATGALEAGEYPVEGVYYDYRAYYNIK